VDEVVDMQKGISEIRRLGTFGERLQKLGTSKYMFDNVTLVSVEMVKLHFVRVI
jgi:hypothetical protein